VSAGGSRLAPGGTVGILGGGQLGRMLALAAAPLGYRCHVFCPDAEAPAADVAARWTRADYLDEAALDAFAAAVDVVTYEFENVPVAAAERLARLRPVRPGPKALAVAQDRLAEKRFAAAAGVGTATFAPVDDLAGLVEAVAATGLPAVLKTRRFGYDGKGQAILRVAADLEPAWRSLGGVPALLEGFVPFERELSVLGARGLDGAIRLYDPIENRHEAHILAVSRAPAEVPLAVAAAAGDIGRRLLAGLDYVGMLAVELFLLSDGRLLFNEMAPRVHNSGHWTIEGAETSQFEQHIRAICGLPLGAAACRGEAEMRNLIGRDVERWPELLAEPGAHLHLYGKRTVRDGRKMGHVTRVRPPRR